MSTVAELLSDIDSYLADSGIAETTFGRLAVNDGKFVGRLRSGAGVTIATVDRVKAYLRQEKASRNPDPVSRKDASARVA